MGASGHTITAVRRVGAGDRLRRGVPESEVEAVAGSAEAMGADMTNGWEQWEGRTVDEKFVLEKFLGGSDGSAVFRAHGAMVREDAAIKFVAVYRTDAENQLRRWMTASEFSHPNLIRLSAQGRCVIEGREFVYAVEEFADENLGQIVPERALTAEEVRGMLKPVLAAVEYVHAKGLVHGHIRPSNIFAIGDQVKLSSDSLLQPGEVPRTNSTFDAPELMALGASPASDMWSLGMTVVDVMTQHTPGWDAARMSPPVIGEEVPEPFRTIARRCLEMDPEARCGIPEIREKLDPSAVQQMTALRELVTNGAVAPVEKWPSKWPYWLAAVAAIAIVALLLLWRHPAGTTSPAAQPTTTQNAPVETPPEPSSRPSPLGEKAPEREYAAPQSSASKNEVVERVSPEVAASARRTIQGKIKVRVHVDVDADGNVTAASLKESGPSKYFARAAEEAAKRWKFIPAQDKRQVETWTLLFVFTRAGTEMSAAKAR
jgi:TonB family protein